MNAIRGAFDLFSDTNKALGAGDQITSEPIDEYESSLKEVDIIELVSQWKKSYASYFAPIEKTQILAFDYWIGKQRAEDGSQLTKDSTNNVVDNLMFEAIETFLPIATRSNPEPLVSADPSEMGQKLAKDIKVALAHEADVQKLRRKMAKMTRHWTLYRLGVSKVSWDVQTKEIKTEVINPRRLILDKDGYIDEGGNFIGEYIGEKKKASAYALSEMFPKKKELISAKSSGKMGTKLEYFEWWYRKDNRWEDVFYTLDDEVLGKYKNPNWNYSGKTEEVNPMTGEAEESEIQGVNHFRDLRAPYVFLSMFTTGNHPHDDTSLIMQNVTIQDMINRRWRQIDRNVEGMNNGMVLSGDAFTEEQASQAAAALRRGVAIRVPNGKVGDAVQRFAAEPLASTVFQSLQDGRSELRGIFGTSGSTPQGIQREDTVRGKIMVNQQDSSRIGGGVTEQLEQVADTIYNWWVQMMFVFYDEEHFITTAGSQGGMELITLKNASFPLLKTLTVTVKEGSLVPKDPLTQRNEAIDLWSANAIDPFNFYKKLDFPDPAQATQQLILWQMFQKGMVPPQAYLPSFQVPTGPAQVGQVQQPAVSPPATTPPPEGAQQPVPTSPEAIEAQSQATLASVPL